jgi:hypothetical protein
MDAELELRWRVGGIPFDGVTVTVETLMPLTQLRQALLVLVYELEAHWPDAVLRYLHDWHEHDGVTLPPLRTCAWAEVRQLLASDEVLYAARADDTYVRVGLYPEGAEFYLRFYPEADDEEPDPPRAEHLGDFDLTCSPALAEAVTARLTPLHLAGLQCGPAKELFDRRWAGE